MDASIWILAVWWFASISKLILGFPFRKWESENGTENIRFKRDENERVRGAYGRGVGFFIGEPCETSCNNILYHVYCNQTTGKCECLTDYPVNIENSLCVKVAKIGEECKHKEACTYYDEYAICHPDGDCRCDENHQSQKTESGDTICIPATTKGILENSDITTLISVVAGLMIFIALFCLVLKLFSRARFGPRDRLGDASAPSVVMTAMDASGSSVIGSRPPSRTSGSIEYLPGSRGPSYRSRRPSTSSIRSQLSLRSHSSFRCPRGHRDIVRRTVSSPADAHPSPDKAKPCHSHNTNEDKQLSPEHLLETHPNHI